MMKKFLLTICLMFAAVFLVAQQNSKGEFKGDPDDFGLTSMEVSTAQMEGFDARTLQKWEDFLGYVSIISDPEVAGEMRQHTRDLARSLFREGKIEFSLSSNLEELPATDNLEDFLENLVTNSQSRLDLILVDGEIEERIQGRQESDILTKMELTIRGKTTPVFHISAEVHYFRTFKMFGSQKIPVWEVVLGKVEGR